MKPNSADFSHFSRFSPVTLSTSPRSASARAGSSGKSQGWG
ncbi:hypothetical protein [Streptomyces scabiei]|nr:hypothetical protein [Streptomyces scabiei]